MSHDYIELERHTNMPTILESPRATQRSLQHLQRCLQALDQIKAIAGHGSPISGIATAAILNTPQEVGGTVV